MAQYRDDQLIREIAQKIKQLREERGITQEQFYNDTEIHIARVETAKTNITVSSLKRICEYLGVTLNEFFSSP